MLRTLDKRQKGGDLPKTLDASESVPVKEVKTQKSARSEIPRQKPPESSRDPLKSQTSAPPRDIKSTDRSESSVKCTGISRQNQNVRPDIKESLPPDYGRIVWITDQEEGFHAARILDFSKSGFTLSLLNSAETVNRKYEEVFSSEDDPTKSVEDNCALMHLNEATLLSNCRLRYKNGKIYSYVANILISINPYQTIDGFYSIQKIKEYRGKSLGQKEPHIYAIADKSYREMRRHRKSQSIIISGESGAGKTESQKAVLQYLCENWGSDAGPIQHRLLEASPILEAFGNAKTLRNNNSSRFGKFVQIHFAENGNVIGGYVSHYLLETSRICRQASGERNYHIFYQLIAGSSPEMYQYLALNQPHCFNYLKNGFVGFFTHPNSTSPTKISKSRCSDSLFSQDSMVDDFRDFQRLDNALKLSGLKEKELLSIWSIIAGILHLGNIEFEENVGDSKGGCKIVAASERSLEQAARLLGLEIIELKLGLCAKIMQTTKGGSRGTLIRVPLNSYEATAGRDALSKAIYAKLFDWLVLRINQSIPFKESTHFTGVLDVAGFEYYASNSFEQFCINFCNEKLQNFFNERILKEEQELYEREGLNVRKIEFVDNRDCIALFETKGTGLFDLLDEESKLPTPSYKNYTKRAHEENKNHFRLDTPRKSKVKSDRGMRDEEGFLIRHYAGSVCYETKQFLEKNDDQLHNSLEILIEQSTSPLLVCLFTTSSSGSNKPGNKLKSQSVGFKFKSQLSSLLEKLQSTGTHFVRCIKPNNQMTPWQFDGSAILSQLQCAGMTSVLKLMQDGFPSRTSFGDLYSSYERKLPIKLARLEPRLFSKCLFRALGLDHHDFQFGLTKVFFRSGKFAEFDQMMKQDPESMGVLISRVNEWLVKSRWRQTQYAVWSVIRMKNNISRRKAQVTKLQSMARGYLARQRFSRQIQIYRKSRTLLKNSEHIEKILTRLNERSRLKWTDPARSTIKDLEKLAAQIKTFSVEQIDKTEKAYEFYAKRVDSMISDLKKQQKNDEIEELEMRRKIAEENEKKELEKKRQMLQEVEKQKRIDEQQARKQREHENLLVDEIRKASAERDKNEMSAQQEKLDAMVANRLAESDGVPLATAPESSSGNSTMKSSGQYDLAHWKYAELRDAINNSMDITLLVACEEEFRRRLRIYNEWKSRNAAKREEHSSATASLRGFGGNSTTHLQQRFFKYAFDAGAQLDFSFSGKTGMWYAHFSGQHIQRQLTIRPSQMPQLMIAGRDDLQMCELTLRETGLEHKQGAEITEEEFENQWKSAGGE